MFDDDDHENFSTYECPLHLVPVLTKVVRSFDTLGKCCKAVKTFPDEIFDGVNGLTIKLRQEHCDTLADLLEKTAAQLQIDVLRIKNNFSVTKTEKLPNGCYRLSLLINDKWLQINREFLPEELGIKE